MSSAAANLTSSRVRSDDGCTVLDLTARRSIDYRVVNVERPVFDLANARLVQFVEDRQTFAVFDEKVLSLYGADAIAYLSSRTNLVHYMSMPGSEDAKRWESVERICANAMECGLDRSAVVIAIGGGVVMDVVGVASSLYRRGVDYLRIPTTLIGMVDVAMGIKTAFNFQDKKNALGAFYPPLGAIADRGFLKTLGRRHIACGLAEIVKMGVVREAHLFALVERFGRRLIDTSFFEPAPVAEEILLSAQASMMDELEPNLFEHDKRRLVDFGHSVSPALEAATHYALPHGEAVAIDMLLSSAIGAVTGVCDARVFLRLRSTCAEIGLPLRSGILTPDFIEHAFHDVRKHRGGSLNLVVPTELGSATFVQEVAREDVERALAMLQ